MSQDKSNFHKILLDDQSFLVFAAFMTAAAESESNSDNNAVLNPPPETQSAPNIIGYKRSAPISMIHFVEQVAIFNFQGYQLRCFELYGFECHHCGQKFALTMVYENPSNIDDNHAFELCLSCYTAFKMTPLYASAEESTPDA